MKAIWKKKQCLPEEGSGPRADRQNLRLLSELHEAGHFKWRPTRRLLGRAGRKVQPGQYPPLLQGALLLAREGFDPGPFLSAMLDCAAAGHSTRFLPILGLAADLARRHIDPSRVVILAVDASVRLRSEEAFREVLDFLATDGEAYASKASSATSRQRVRCSEEFWAAAALPVDGRRSAVQVIQSGALPPISAKFDRQHYLAALDFAVRLLAVQRDAYRSCASLQFLAESVSWEQFVCTLDFVLANARPGFPFVDVPHAAQLAARTSQSLDEFLQVLQLAATALEQSTIPRIEAWSKSAEALDRAGVITLFQFLVARGANGGIDANSFPEVLRRIVSLAPASSRKLGVYLEVIPHLPIASGGDHPVNLAETLIKTAGLVSREPGDLERNLRALCGIYQPPPGNRLSFGRDTLLTALGLFEPGMEPAAVEREAAVLRRLVEESGGHFAANPRGPGIVDLYRQVTALRPDYQDLEIVVRPAITHEEEYSDYYGTHSSTVTDREASIEIHPRGERLSNIVLELVPTTRMLELMNERSWIWATTQADAARADATDRIARVRAYLPAAIDALVRQGLLRPNLKSVYLIGSYPWLQDAGDIDLFVVYNGAVDPVYLNPRQLSNRGTNLQLNGVPFSLEATGEENLRLASAAPRSQLSDRLRLRYALLFGSVLLAGDDLFPSGHPPGSLAALAADLRQDAARADWPELRDQSDRRRRKQAWREHEAAAIERFLGALPASRSPHQESGGPAVSNMIVAERQGPERHEGNPSPATSRTSMLRTLALSALLIALLSVATWYWLKRRVTLDVPPEVAPGLGGPTPSVPYYSPPSPDATPKAAAAPEAAPLSEIYDADAHVWWVRKSPLVAKYGERTFNVFQEHSEVEQQVLGLNPFFEVSDTAVSSLSHVARLEDGRQIFIMHGCRAHACSSDFAAIAIDFANNKAHMIEYHDSSGGRFYGDDPAIKGLLEYVLREQNWITEMDETDPIVTRRNVKYRLDYASLLAEQGDLQNALIECSRALKLLPKDPRALELRRKIKATRASSFR